MELVNISGVTQQGAEPGSIAPSPAVQPRQGWNEQFGRMVRLGDDRLLDGENLTASAWDETEWKW